MGRQPHREQHRASTSGERLDHERSYVIGRSGRERCLDQRVDRLGDVFMSEEYRELYQDKLADLMQCAELIYSAGVAAALECTTAGPGTAVPDPVKTNAGKNFAGIKFYEALRAVHDIAGGLVVTMPGEADYHSPVTQPYLEKYFKGAKGIPTLDRLKLFKFIRDLTE